MEHKKTLNDSFTCGEKKAKDKGIIGASWLDFYNFKGDPFIENLSNEELAKIFVNRNSILEELGEYIGGSKYAQNFYHIGIMGPKGIGKSVLLKLVNFYASEKYSTGFYDISKDRFLYNETRNPQLTLDSNVLNCIFFDNCNPIDRLIKRIEIRKKMPGVLISALNPTIPLDKLSIDKLIILKTFNSKEIVQIIKNRLSLVGNPSSLPDNFYKSIANVSMGNPLIAFEYAKGCLDNYFGVSHDLSTIEIFIETYFKHQKRDLERRINVVNTSWEELTTKEKSILALILSDFEDIFDINDLLEKTESGRTLIWKYLKELNQKELIFKSYIGRKTYYSVILPTKNILEKHFIEEREPGIFWPLEAWRD